MNDIRRTAIAIIFAEMEGNKFDWNTYDFIKDD